MSMCNGFCRLLVENKIQKIERVVGFGYSFGLLPFRPKMMYTHLFQMETQEKIVCTQLIFQGLPQFDGLFLWLDIKKNIVSP